MTGKTHRTGGVLCALLGCAVLERKGMLIKDVSPLLQLTVMYPFAIYGSTISDLDHNWNSCPNKDLISYCINKVLHLTTKLRQNGISNTALSVLDSKHRSWQTHSDLFFWSILLAIHTIIGMLSGAGVIIFKMVSTGFLLGVISHLVLDMLTPEGIWVVPFMLIRSVTGLNIPEKIHFVPKSGFFATGGRWETFVQKLMWMLSFILILYLAWRFSPYKITLNL